MSSGVAELVTHLQGALPDYRVCGYVSALDAVPRPTVLVWAETLNRGPTLSTGLLYVDFRVQVVVGLIEPDQADAPLWEATAAVLAAVGDLGWIEWTRAQRGVRADNFHAYTIELVAHGQITTGEDT